MTIKFNITGPRRKELVELIADFTGSKARFCGTPTFAYEVGCFYIDRHSTVTVNPAADSEMVERMMQMLYDNGFPGECEAEENDDQAVGLVVTLPKETMSEDAIGRLERLIEAKGSLIQKAIGADRLPIDVTEDKVSFPWFSGEPTAEEVKAYTHLVSALCEMARNQKRVTAKEKEVDNDKYAFRCFLLRLGFIGDEFKIERKILLRNLTGSSAFKGGTKNAVSE